MKQQELFPHGINGQPPPPAARPRRPARLYRPQVRTYSWEHMPPRPWTGEVVRLVGPAWRPGAFEVVGIHGVLRDVVELDPGGLRRGDVFRVGRGELRFDLWPQYVHTCRDRAQWYLDADVWPGGGRREPGRSPIMRPCDEALAAQRDSERYLERGLPWPTEREAAR